MNVTTKMGPFMKSKDNNSKMVMRFLIALLPIILFAFYKNGILLYIKGYTNFFGMFYPLIFIILGAMSSFITEEAFLFIFKKYRKKELLKNIKLSYGFLPGLLLSLILPINTPLAILFVGGIFASLIGKMAYGGNGKNIFNPALVGTIFVFTCYGSLITGLGGNLNLYERTLTSVEPINNISLSQGISYDTAVKPYGNLLDFFIGNVPGTFGGVSNLLIIISFIYLTVTKTIKWRVTSSYVLTYTLLLLLFNFITGYGMWYVLFELFIGGLLFNAVFIATDNTTSPVTIKGQLLYGMCLGLITFILRYRGLVDASIISILSMNLLVVFFDKIGSRIEYNKYYYIAFGVVGVLLISSAIYIGLKNVKDNIMTSDFQIINVIKEDNKTKYEVLQKGFGGNIKALITFNSRNITDIEILEHYESKDSYKKVLDKDYINKLLIHQNEVENVDTISGATITTSAIKKMIQNTIDVFTDTSNVSIVSPSIELVSTQNNKDAIVYILRLDSYNGKMDIQFVMKNNNIRTAIPKKYNDACISEMHKSNFYECPTYLENEYIDTLIINQNNLENVDTVSGATISSKALKEAFIYMKEGGING